MENIDAGQLEQILDYSPGNSAPEIGHLSQRIPAHSSNRVLTSP